MFAAPRVMPGPVMPGVQRTPGRLRGGDAPGGPDLPPCPGYRTPYIVSARRRRTDRAARLPRPPLAGGGGFSIKSGGVFYQYCIARIVDVSLVYYSCITAIIPIHTVIHQRYIQYNMYHISQL